MSLIAVDNLSRRDAQVGGCARPGRSAQGILGELRSPVNLICLAALIGYAIAFCRSIPWWFDPNWTTDDALQQAFPFWKVVHPELFRGDLITRMMECYLSPLHYLVSWSITYLTYDPIMTGHWVMLIQLLLTAFFVFGAVRGATAFAPACIAVMWLLHTRHVMQRLTGGLPRGWAAPVLAAFFYFALRRNHRGMLCALFLGCLSHPPAALVAAAAYGATLVWRWLQVATRAEYRRPLLEFVLVSPLIVLSTYFIVRMPPEIGEMATYDKALSMPEFQKPRGRFPFVPLRDPVDEIRSFGFQAFADRFYNPAVGLPSFLKFDGIGKHIKAWVPETVTFLFLIGLLIGVVRHRRLLIPAEAVFYLLGALSVYELSRILAFRLYVPDRHLQFPLAIFFVVGMTITFWRAGSMIQVPGTTDHSESSAQRFGNGLGSWLMLAPLAALVIFASGSGLQGSANFNYSTGKRGGVFAWLRDHTPLTSLVAGEPTHIDAMQLFARRQAYVTTETAHPFYDQFYREMKRRLEVTWKAHYAKSLGEIVALLKPEGVNYFVFRLHSFDPDNLKEATYFSPFEPMIRALTSADPTAFAFSALPARVNMKEFPAMPYRDKQSVVLNIDELDRFLSSRSEPRTPVGAAEVNVDATSAS